MLNFFTRFFKESMIGASLVISIFIFSGLYFIVPHLAKEKSIENAYAESQRLTTYIRIFRAYYAGNILNKIKEHSDLNVNFDHRENGTTVPLPATLVHDLGGMFTDKTDASIEMYSNFPFPNREDRVLDRFQQDALAYILKNPTQSFSREDIVDGKKVYRTAFGDPLSAPSCVGCHNSRADTPKNDWELGDIRGAIEVQIPLQLFTISTKNFLMIVLPFIVLNLILLGVFYFLSIKRKNESLELDVDNKSKILSEYKKAVDLGAIVSKSDKSGRITYVNDAFCEVSGYTYFELIGQNHNILRHPDSSPEMFKEMWGNLLNKKVWSGDIKNKKKDGSTYFVHATIVPILDSQDNIVEFLAIRYETTQLHKAIIKANIAEKAKGDFLANMSHELRTPLNAIIGFSQILQRKSSFNEKDKSYIDKINLSGNNLLTLVNSILDFSKIEEGEMEYFPENVNIQHLFQEILTLVENQANDKAIKISLINISAKDTIFVDKQLIKQAFINILSNAVKFTPENGAIKIEYSQKNAKHLFSICDNGVGIEPEDLKELFLPFKQGQSAKQSSAKGTGLGLAITHKIITKLHSGTISVTSIPNQGTCFKISL